MGKGMLRAMIRRVVAVTAASAIGMASLAPAPASADSADANYLNNVGGMNQPGLNALVQAAPDVVIKAGRSECTMLDGGYGTRLSRGCLTIALNSDYDAMVVGVQAVSAYCPRHQADSGFGGNF
jgi:ABC-type enterochelin transport system substrate-binding protein